MVDELTAHEVSLFKKMAPRNRSLLSRLTEAERHSLAQNVNLGNINLIESWIGDEKDMEKILFWDKGGKYDDTEWRRLKPVDEKTAILFQKAKEHYEQLREEAIENQIRSDLALYSQFNTGLLFTGLSGAVRCNSQARPNDYDFFFQGVGLRCIGSVEENINSITIFPIGQDQFEVHFGGRKKNSPQGICVYSGDSFSLIQLANLTEKDIPNIGFETTIMDQEGKTVLLDPKAIRRDAHRGEPLGYEKELILCASIRVKGIEKALEMADNLSRCFYARFGLETECYKIGKKYGNFFIMRNDNFDCFFSDSPFTKKGLVLFTATLVCRRCRRELEGFRDFSRLYPEATFSLVNLASPQSKFYERVFADMGGGDGKQFRDHAMGSTPFVIIYVPDGNGVLRFAEYYGTEKVEAPPSVKHCIKLFDKYFR